MAITGFLWISDPAITLIPAGFSAFGTTVVAGFYWRRARGPAVSTMRWWNVVLVFIGAVAIIAGGVAVLAFMTVAVTYGFAPLLNVLPAFVEQMQIWQRGALLFFALTALFVPFWLGIAAIGWRMGRTASTRRLLRLSCSLSVILLAFMAVSVQQSSSEPFDDKIWAGLGLTIITTMMMIFALSAGMGKPRASDDISTVFA